MVDMPRNQTTTASKSWPWSNSNKIMHYVPLISTTGASKPDPFQRNIYFTPFGDLIALQSI